MRAQRTFAAAVLLAAASLLSAQALAAGVAGFHPACGTCHKAEPPAAANADPIACHGCHGETPEKGSVVVNGKTLNPHARALRRLRVHAVPQAASGERERLRRMPSGSQGADARKVTSIPIRSSRGWDRKHPQAAVLSKETIMSAQFSRRDFFKVAGASSAVAVTTPAVMAGDIPEKWRAPKCTGWSWEKPAEPIPDAEVKKTVETDVVVIGARARGRRRRRCGPRRRRRSRPHRKDEVLGRPRRPHHRLRLQGSEGARRQERLCRNRPPPHLLGPGPHGRAPSLDVRAQVRRLHGLGSRHVREERRQGDALGRLLQWPDLY